MKEYEQIITTALKTADEMNDHYEYAYVNGIQQFIVALGNCVPEGLIVSALKALKVDVNAN